MWIDLRITLFVAAVALPANVLPAYAVSGLASDNRASVESFSSISDPAARSAAYFTELGKVLTNPRCLNCHPAGDRPRQGDTATASAAGRTGRRRLRSSGDAMSDLPSGSKLRA